MTLASNARYDLSLNRNSHCPAGSTPKQETSWRSTNDITTPRSFSSDLYRQRGNNGNRQKDTWCQEAIVLRHHPTADLSARFLSLFQLRRTKNSFIFLSRRQRRLIRFFLSSLSSGTQFGGLLLVAGTDGIFCSDLLVSLVSLLVGYSVTRKSPRGCTGYGTFTGGEYQLRSGTEKTRMASSLSAFPNRRVIRFPNGWTSGLCCGFRAWN